MKKIDRFSSLITISIFIAGWLLYCYGLIWMINSEYNTALWKTVAASFGGIIFTFLMILCWVKREKLWSFISDHLEQHTDNIDSLPDSQVGLWIALAAGIGLYAELAIIRFHASCFQLFGYFKNISLLSCFLGLGIGYLRGKRRPLLTPLVLPLLALQISCMHILRFHSSSQSFHNPIPERLGWIKNASELSHFMPVYGFLILVFSFNALCFIPLGQIASRLMDRKDKLVAYGWNLAGSLLGILFFTFLSSIWSPPAVWFLFVILILIILMRGHRFSLLAASFSGLILLSVLSISLDINKKDVYSPYQILTLSYWNYSNVPIVQVNNVWYQQMLRIPEEDIRKQGSDYSPDQYRYIHYLLPYYYFRNKPEDVLIVGSGTGNDVAAAVNQGAGNIDAVEIDPAILKIGEMIHPNRPYQAKNVNVIINDARAFIRQTEKKYDLIVYGLLDSHTLLASTSGVRLDSYVYTVEAFREARSRLKEDGIISLTFACLTKEMAYKMFLMLKDAFDSKEPLVYLSKNLPYYTFIIGENLPKDEKSQLMDLESMTVKVNQYRCDVNESTDDWPFLYMAKKKYPLSYVAMILLLSSISIIFVLKFASGSNVGFSAPCFFLGAGFMLIETKGITELALVFGSTWVVVSAVIAAIMIMAFFANLLIIKIKIPHPLIIYSLLLASLFLGLYASSIKVNPLWLEQIIVTMLLTVPIFFSGIAFSVELKKSVSVAVALSSNLLGAMLGGFLEYNSMYFGFLYLYYFAFVIYSIAFITSLRTQN